MEFFSINSYKKRNYNLKKLQVGRGKEKERGRDHVRCGSKKNRGVKGEQRIAVGHEAGGGGDSGGGHWELGIGKIGHSSHIFFPLNRGGLSPL